MTAAQYPSSWYAASCDIGPARLGLEGPLEAEFCIIGGGFTGLSVALTLAEAGKSVILLEARRIGWGASGRNGGQLIRGFVGQGRMLRHLGASSATDVAALTWAGHDLIKKRLQDYAIDCDYTEGWIEVAPTKRQFNRLKAFHSSLSPADEARGWQFFSRQELVDTLKTDAYEGGLLSKSDAHLHPLKLCLGLRDACLKRGVKIYENSPVTAINTGVGCDVITPNGRVKARRVVLAANAHHTLLQEKLGGYAYPAGSFIIATDPLPTEMRKALNPHNWAICDTKKVCDYFRMSADGRVLFGGRVNYSGNKPKSVKQALLPRLLAVWPQLQDIGVSYEWGGKLAVPMAQAPLVGEIGPHISYAFGYTGHGVNTGNMLGEIVAEALLGNRHRFNMFAKLPKWRLPFGQCIGQQMVAAAILYYKITDRL